MQNVNAYHVYIYARLDEFILIQLLNRKMFFLLEQLTGFKTAVALGWLLRKL